MVQIVASSFQFSLDFVLAILSTQIDIALVQLILIDFNDYNKILNNINYIQQYIYCNNQTK